MEIPLETALRDSHNPADDFQPAAGSARPSQSPPDSTWGPLRLSSQAQQSQIVPPSGSFPMSIGTSMSLAEEKLKQGVDLDRSMDRTALHSASLLLFSCCAFTNFSFTVISMG